MPNNYKVILSQEALNRVEAYKRNLAQKNHGMGSRLKKAIDQQDISAISMSQFINLLLHTKDICIPGESKHEENESNWNKDELLILSEINFDMSIELYDDGGSGNIQVYPRPIRSHLLLSAGAKPNTIVSPDAKQAVGNAQKDSSKDSSIERYEEYERRVVSLLQYANDDASEKGKQALIHFPFRLCNDFSESSETGQKHFQEFVREILNKHTHKFPKIEVEISKKNFLKRLRGSDSDRFEVYNCLAVWPYDDADSRVVNATNIMQVMTGIKGVYDEEQHVYDVPKLPLLFKQQRHITNWESLIENLKIRMKAENKIYIRNNGKFQQLDADQSNDEKVLFAKEADTQLHSEAIGTLKNVYFSEDQPDFENEALAYENMRGDLEYLLSRLGPNQSKLRAAVEIRLRHYFTNNDNAQKDMRIKKKLFKINKTILPGISNDNPNKHEAENKIINDALERLENVYTQQVLESDHIEMPSYETMRKDLESVVSIQDPNRSQLTAAAEVLFRDIFVDDKDNEISDDTRELLFDTIEKFSSRIRKDNKAVPQDKDSPERFLHQVAIQELEKHYRRPAQSIDYDEYTQLYENMRSDFKYLVSIIDPEHSNLKKAAQALLKETFPDKQGSAVDLTTQRALYEVTRVTLICSFNNEKVKAKRKSAIRHYNNFAHQYSNKVRCGEGLKLFAIALLGLGSAALITFAIMSGVGVVFTIPLAYKIAASAVTVVGLAGLGVGEWLSRNSNRNRARDAVQAEAYAEEIRRPGLDISI